MAERQSNFELLRIIAILFIILCHISYYGGLRNGVYYIDLNANTFFLQCIYPLGGIGVNLFVLITGYFLCDSKKDPWPKVFKLWLTLEFYSVLFAVLFMLGDHQDFSSREWFNIFTPFLRNRWWFATCYIILLVISPFINKVIHEIDEKTHFKLIVGALVLWMFIPSFTGINIQFSELIWFITLYFVGAYISKNPVHFQGSSKRYIMGALCVYAICMVVVYSVQVTEYHSTFWNVDNVAELLVSKHGLFCGLTSILIFLAFSRLTISYNRAINLITQTTFGIYLIHEFTYVRRYIYTRFFDIPGWLTSELLIVYVFFVCLVIFTVCFIEEYLRQKFFDRFINRAFQEKIQSLRKIIDDKLETFLKK